MNSVRKASGAEDISGQAKRLIPGYTAFRKSNLRSASELLACCNFRIIGSVLRVGYV